MKKQLKYLIIPVLLLMSLSLLPAAQAVACPANGCYINITVYRYDTGGALSGAVVANTSNATQTATTGADGAANISWYDYSNSSASGGHNLTITAPAGYNNSNIAKIEIAGNAVVNDTLFVKLIPLGVLQTSISAGTITKTGATVSWTNNFSVDNRIKYSQDSGLATNYFYTAWNNATTSPSRVLSNLDVYKKYYYQVESYNPVNNSYTTTSSILNFTTLSGTYLDKKKQYVIPADNPAANKILSDIQKAQGQTSGYTQTQKIIAFIAIILVLYIVLGGGGKKRK